MRLLFSDTLTGEDYWSDVSGVTFDGPSVAAAVMAKIEAGMEESGTKAEVLFWRKDGDTVAVFVFDMSDGLTSAMVHGTALLMYDPVWVPPGGRTQC